MVHCGFPYFRDEPKHESVERRCGEKVRTSLGILRTPFLALHDLYMRSEVWIPMLYFCKACIWHSPAPKKKWVGEPFSLFLPSPLDETIAMVFLKPF